MRPRRILTVATLMMVMTGVIQAQSQKQQPQEEDESQLQQTFEQQPPASKFDFDPTLIEVPKEPFVPVRHDVRVGREPCSIITEAGDADNDFLSYQVVMACLDSQFPFPDDHRLQTVKTVKSLISNFYVFEDLAGQPPVTPSFSANPQGLSVMAVSILKELDDLVASDATISIGTEDEDADDDDNDNDNDDDDDDDDDVDDDDESDKKSQGSDQEEKHASRDAPLIPNNDDIKVNKRSDSIANDTLPITSLDAASSVSENATLTLDTSSPTSLSTAQDTVAITTSAAPAGENDSDGYFRPLPGKSVPRHPAPPILIPSPPAPKHLRPPPSPIINLRQRLTDRQFHEGISQIFRRVRDGHLSYDADCFRSFRWQQGIVMAAVQDEVNGDVATSFSAKIKIHAVNSTIVDAALAMREPALVQVNDDAGWRAVPDWSKCEVVSINGENAMQYLQMWADKFVSSSKNANIRFNLALASPQYRSGVIDFFYPGRFAERFVPPEESSISYILRCPTATAAVGSTDVGQKMIRLDLPWVASYSFIKTRPFSTTQEYFDLNCWKGNSDDEEDSASSPFPSSSRPSIEKNENNNQKENDKHVMKSSGASGGFVNDAMSRKRTKGSKKARKQRKEKDQKKEKKEKVRDASNDNIKMQEENEVMLEEDEIDFGNLLQLRRAQEQHRKGLQRLPVEKFYDDEGGRPSEAIRSEDVPEYREVFKGDQGISAALLADGKTGVISIRSFSSIGPKLKFRYLHQIWVTSLLKAIQALRPVANNLILDLSHNGGGYVCLAMIALQIFFPTTPRSVTNVRISPLSSRMFRAGRWDHFESSVTGQGSTNSLRGDKDATTGILGSPLFQDRRHPSRSYPFSDFMSDSCLTATQYDVSSYLTNNSAATNSAAYTNESSSSSPSSDDGQFEASQLLRINPIWAPANMVILTDGYCGSACALVANTMRNSFGVRTVATGGSTADSGGNGNPMAYSTFPGLQVIDDSYIFMELGATVEWEGRMSRLQTEKTNEKMETNTPEAKKDKKVLDTKNENQDDDDDDDDNDEDENEDEEENENENGAKPKVADMKQQDVDDDDDQVDDQDSDKNNDPQSLNSVPSPFPHKCRLRLTWRQIYLSNRVSSPPSFSPESVDSKKNTERQESSEGTASSSFSYSGSVEPPLDLFNSGPPSALSSSPSSGNLTESRIDASLFREPNWSLLQMEKWTEYSFLAADARIPYTKSNIHSIGKIWASARDQMWSMGAKSVSTSQVSYTDGGDADQSEISNLDGQNGVEPGSMPDNGQRSVEGIAEVNGGKKADEVSVIEEEVN